MSQKQLEDLQKKARALAKRSDNFLSTLSNFEDTSGNPFEIARILRGGTISAADTISKVSIATDLIAALDVADNSGLLPSSAITSASRAVDDLSVALDALTKQVDAINKGNGGLQTINYETLLATARDGSSHDLDAFFSNLSSSLDQLLAANLTLLPFAKGRSGFKFQSASRALTKVIAEASESLASLKSAQKKVGTTQNALDDLVSQVTAHVDEAKRQRGEAESDRKTIGEYLAQANEQRAGMNAAYEEATKLRATIRGSQATIDQFDKNLAERQNQFTDWSSRADALLAKLDTDNENITGLITRAEQMLSSATVAGLASNFSKIKDQLTRELWWARFAFYVSIGILFISAVPLFAIVLTPFFGFLKAIWPSIPDVDVNNINPPVNSQWQYIAQVIARVVLLVPAAWLVSFTAIRHASLFRLREHYAYKYSMAVAVEGFKLQSPKYDQEIAAMVLEHLAFNPADKLTASKDIKEGKAPGLAGHILDLIRKAPPQEQK